MRQRHDKLHITAYEICMKSTGIAKPRGHFKQAGTGPSRRHIQGSKIAKGFRSVNLQYSKIEKLKNGPGGSPGPASASPWRAKRGTLQKLSTFLSQMKRGKTFLVQLVR